MAFPRLPRLASLLAICALTAPPAAAQLLQKTGEVLYSLKIERGVTGDQFGRDVDLIGDLDDDGNPDIVVGASHDDDGTQNSGSIYILFLNADQTVKSTKRISQTNNGFTGPLGVNNWFGKAVTGLGDLDGDGVEDIAVGAPSENNGSERRVFIIFMNSDGTVRDWQTIQRSTNGFGRAVHNVGDMDGDGVVDLMIGTAFGSVYLYYLNSNGTVKSFQTYNEHTNSTPGYDSFYGLGIAPIGDLDGDGECDVAIGDTATDFGGVTDSGSMYLSLVDTDGTAKSEIPLYDGLPNLVLNLPEYPNFGRDAALLNDLDGNGVPDLAIGCSEYYGTGDPTDSGAVFVVFLNSNGSVVDHRKISRTSGNLGQSLRQFNEFGISVAPLGDLNGDGTVDLVVGARFDGAGSIFLLMMNDGTLTFPESSWTATPTSGDAPLGVQFTDTSTGSVTSWLWDFGDGGMSTEQNPLHPYNAAGVYDVTLTVSGPGEMVHATTVEAQIDVSASAGPVANFAAAPTRGPLPLTVDFTDLSTGSPTSWSWDFGDGQVSTEQNPSHVYTAHGVYSVSLMATSSGGSDVATEVDLVTAGIYTGAGAGAGAAPSMRGPGGPPSERHGLETAAADTTHLVRDAAGLDWIDDGGGAPGRVEPYGCGTSEGNLALTGSATVGGELVFTLDAPASAARAGSVVHLLLASAPHAEPCSRATAGVLGSALTDWRNPAHRLGRIAAPAATEPGRPTEVTVAIPDVSALAGFELYAQGVFVDRNAASGTRLAFTRAVRIVLGP